MKISDIKIRKLLNDGRLRAIVSVTFDGQLAVHDIKIVQGAERLFVAMPSRREENGTFRDIVHPISPEARNALEEEVLDAYRAAQAGSYFPGVPFSPGIPEGLH